MSAPRSPDEVFYARTFALVAIALLAYLLYAVLAPFFAPIAWACFIAFLVHPLHARLARRARPAVSAALLTVAAVVVLVGPLAALAAAFATQVSELLRHAQSWAAEQRAAGAAELADLPVIGPALAWVEQASGFSVSQLQSWLIDGARSLLGSLASVGGTALLGALGTLVGFALMVFILFFAIRDGAAFVATLRGLIPMPSAERTRLEQQLAAVTRAMVYGTGVTALVQGALVAIGFAVVGLPSPVVFGVLAALFALVPMAGTPVVWGPACIVLALQNRYLAAAFLVGWGLMVTMLDNFLRPMLVAGRAEVSALMVFIGVLGGVSAFGPIGIVLGPLLLALVVALVRFAQESRSSGD